MIQPLRYWENYCLSYSLLSLKNLPYFSRRGKMHRGGTDCLFLCRCGMKSPLNMSDSGMKAQATKGATQTLGKKKKKKELQKHIAFVSYRIVLINTLIGWLSVSFLVFYGPIITYLKIPVQCRVQLSKTELWTLF